MTQPTFALLGSKTVCLQVLQAAVANQLLPTRVMTPDDRDDTRTCFTELQDLCNDASVPFGIAAPSALAYDELLAETPALVVVAGWYRLIPTDVLDRPERGFFGIHYSRLPRFRGSAPVVWAMLAGERTVGFSLFQLTAGMDEGEIAASGEVAAADRYVGDVLGDLDNEAATTLVDVLPGLLNGTRGTHRQDDVPPSYCGVRTPSDGLLDWTRSADELACAVRAQSRPYPGAFSRVAGGRVRVWRAEVDTTASYFGMPGQCVRLDGSEPIIAAGDNSGLRLTEFDLEPEGGQAVRPVRINSRLY